MRTIVIDLFSASELQILYPSAFGQAHKEFAAKAEAYTDDVGESYRKAVALAQRVYRDQLPEGFHLRHSPQATARRWAMWHNRAVVELTLCVLPGVFYKNGMYVASAAQLGSYIRRRRFTKPGQVPECPLTGYCWDMDFLQDLEDSVKTGCLPDQALRSLSHIFESTCQAIWEDTQSVGYFVEEAESQGYEYTQSGERWVG